MNKQIVKYINQNWDACIKQNINDEGTLIGLPYPYTVPAVGYFDEMYYWDTYFTNKGLELCGRYEQVKNNTDNMLYLVNKYGYMPNGNRTFYLSRSQPPFLSLMVRDVYEHFKDLEWLYSAYKTLKIEYDFWMTKRTFENGLAHYDYMPKLDVLEEAVEEYQGRIGFKPSCSDEQIARHYRTNCESGWDINPRWETEGYNYAAVDLNSLLYMFERNMAYFAEELQNGEEKIWTDSSETRQQLMNRYMLHESGVLLDYNVESDKLSSVFSAASFYPMFAGLCSKEQAEVLVKNLPRLEERYGILTCEKNEVPGCFQWNYPNGWACIQYIVIEGLMRCGYEKEAARIAEKYVSLVEKVFAETNNLWEKYNVVEGNINVSNEYDMPAMMGWSAGVYLTALCKLKEINENGVIVE